MCVLLMSVSVCACMCVCVLYGCECKETYGGEECTVDEKGEGEEHETNTASHCTCVCVCVRVLQQPPHSPDILQWMALMNNNPTCGARVVVLQILH